MIIMMIYFKLHKQAVSPARPRQQRALAIRMYVYTLNICGRQHSNDKTYFGRNKRNLADSS